MSVRQVYTLVEVDTERCQNTYGVAPCTATGSGDGKCYNTIRTCQVRTAYAPTTYTYKFVDRGASIQSGVNARPYISSITSAPTDISPEAGLAPRSSSSINLVGEKDSDVELDPYYRDRVTPPQGMFWHRFLARITNYTDKFVRVRRALITDGVLGAFTTETYVIDTIKGPDPDGAVVMTLKDPITLAGKVKVPTPSDGKLSAPLLISDTSLTIGNGALTTYAQSGYVRVGSEVIKYIDKWVSVGWNFANTADGWIATNASFTTGQYAVTFTASTATPYMTRNGLSIIGGSNRYVAVRFKRTVGTTWSGVLQYSTSLHGFSSTYQKAVSAPAALVTGGDYVTAVWDMLALDSGGDDWQNNTITGLQLYLGSGSSDIYVIDWIAYGNVLSDLWDRVLVCSTSADRAQFGTSAGAGGIGDLVQQCLVYINQPVTAVMQDMITRSGLSSSYIDTAGFTREEDNWFGPVFNVTVCLSSPELISKYLAELALFTGSVMWWSAVSQQIKLRAIMPAAPAYASSVILNDSSSLLENSVKVETLDALRKTFVGVYYGLTSATANMQTPASFLNGDIYVDTDAELEYGGRRTDVQFTRWFQSANAVAMQAWCKRRLTQYRDAPFNVTFRLDPKDSSLKEGDIADLTTDQVTDYRGAPKKTKVMVLRRQSAGDSINCIVRSTTFSRPYGFIAPAGTANYPGNNGYAVISNASGLMSDGSIGSVII